ncbi:hypothetical protein ACRWE6_26325, partial [Escherichia coli]
QVLRAYIFCGACGNNRTNRGGFQFAAARLPWFKKTTLFRGVKEGHCNPEKSCRLFKAVEKGYIADRYAVAFGIVRIREVRKRQDAP